MNQEIEEGDYAVAIAGYEKGAVFKILSMHPLSAVLLAYNLQTRTELVYAVHRVKKITKETDPELFI